MPNQMLVIHERIGNWVRHLRSRLREGSIRIVETRSASDLESALARASCPLVLIDLARRPRAALEELDRAIAVAPDALVLVLDPESYDGAALLARELGATHVISGPVSPPVVAKLLTRWIVLARRRAEASGWSGAAPEPPEPEPWNWLTPLLNVSGALEVSRPARD